MDRSPKRGALITAFRRDGGKVAIRRIRLTAAGARQRVGPRSSKRGKLESAARGRRRRRRVDLRPFSLHPAPPPPHHIWRRTLNEEGGALVLQYTIHTHTHACVVLYLRLFHTGSGAARYSRATRRRFLAGCGTVRHRVRCE